MNDLIDKVDDLVRSDRRVTLRMLALKMDVSYGTVWTIVNDRKQIVIGDETWCHQYEPETKWDSMRHHLHLRSSEP
ncbi:hypothetical protein TNCV_4722911 [Trichonephila clavipes]|uniref:Uncharacterized protein n=1 Tax=Trichonephila clavipes TaxID=2585209 RepID=A0A8X7BFC6_TRICX|nr:hypothetical protein TNCV_4722911 [Trichonephila clavipes]